MTVIDLNERRRIRSEEQARVSDRTERSNKTLGILGLILAGILIACLGCTKTPAEAKADCIQDCTFWLCNDHDSDPQRCAACYDACKTVPGT